MKTILAIVASMVLSGCAANGEWTRADTIGEFAVATSLAVDAYQTDKIREIDGLEEVGWGRGIIGAEPRRGPVIAYFSTLIVGHWLMARALPTPWRKYWQGYVGGVEIKTIIDNERNFRDYQ